MIYKMINLPKVAYSRDEKHPPPQRVKTLITTIKGISTKICSFIIIKLSYQARYGMIGIIF